MEADYYKKWRAKNKVRLAVRHKEWKKNNPDKVKEQRRKYNETHKLEVSLQRKKYRENNKDKILEGSKKYFLKNRSNPKYLYSRYKSKAKSRGKLFTLSLDEFEKIIQEPCHYCHYKQEIPVGIDRKNNAIGYVLNNCLPCCWPCNWLKGARKYELFKSHLSKVLDSQR